MFKYKSGMIAFFFLLIISFALMLAAYPSTSGETIGIYKSPILWFVAVVFALLSGFSGVKNFKKHGLFFTISHISVLVVIVGVLIGYTYGQREMIRVPYDRFNCDFSDKFAAISTSSSRMGMGQTNGQVELPFKMRINKFSIEKFPPKFYQLLVYRTNENGGGYELLAEIAPEPKIVKEIDDQLLMYLDFSKIKELSAKLRNTPHPVAVMMNNQWRWNFKEEQIDRGIILRPKSQAIKHYEAEVIIEDEEKPFVVIVNKPLRYKGWILYLMDYDQHRGSWVAFTARKDPGRLLVLGGLWGLIIGITGICFLGMKKKKGGE